MGKLHDNIIYNKMKCKDIYINLDSIKLTTEEGGSIKLEALLGGV